jgi:hypothetical protein
VTMSSAPHEAQRYEFAITSMHQFGKRLSLRAVERRFVPMNSRSNISNICHRSIDQISRRKPQPERQERITNKSTAFFLQ